MSERREQPGGTRAATPPGEGAEGRILEAEVIEPVPEPGRGGARTLPIPLILALLALGGVFATLGLGYQQLQGQRAAMQHLEQGLEQAGERHRRLLERLEVLDQARAGQEQALERQRARFAEQEQALAREREQLRLHTGEINQSLDQVYRRVARSGSEWIAAEAQYLMRVANHRLRLEADPATAIKALEGADQRLRETGDPGWIEVRRKLAGEIAALRGVAGLDRAGLAARLAALGEQVQGLRIQGTGPVPAARRPEPGARSADHAERSLASLPRDAWMWLKSLLVIRHHGKSVSAMLPPGEQFYIYQNLRLQFEAASLALLRRDQSLYDASLGNAARWIDELFDTGEAATAAVREQIEALRDVRVAEALPDISGSLAALRARLRADPPDGGEAQ
ncbi:MAG: uroporphyrinogen-III C-methyltransferase [Candidatus Sedimenticola endophacoides]